MNKLLFLILFFIILFGGVKAVYDSNNSFESRRAALIDDMQELIQEQVDAGNYRCCIQPACTMCFLGNWIWDDGICRCDDMIASRQDDKVCPQCKKALAQGQCESAQ